MATPFKRCAPMTSNTGDYRSNNGKILRVDHRINRKGQSRIIEKLQALALKLATETIGHADMDLHGVHEIDSYRAYSAFYNGQFETSVLFLEIAYRGIARRGENACSRR